MESFKEALKQLEDSAVFKEWIKENKKCYLSYGFAMVRGDDIWRIGYYNPENQRVVSFVIDKDISMEHEDESFKKPESEVKRLETDKIKIEYDSALEKADALQKEKYSAEIPLKIIMIIQNHNELGQIWNISYITQSFKTLNIKINAENNEILKEEMIALFEFKK